MKRVPMFMPSAPSAMAATSERPSAMPPDAMKGIVNCSRARQQDEVGHVVLARVAAAFKAVHADRVAANRPAFSAWRTEVHLCTTLMPASFSIGIHCCGLLPAVSTTLTPPSMMLRT